MEFLHEVDYAVDAAGFSIMERGGVNEVLLANLLLLLTSLAAWEYAAQQLVIYGSMMETVSV